MSEKHAETDDLKLYEVMIIFHPDLTEQKFAQELEKFKKHLKEDQKAKITFEKVIGRRELQTPIMRQQWGIYVVLNFELGTENLAEVDESLRLDNNVLRHLILNLPDGYTPKIIFEQIDQEKKQRTPKSNYAKDKIDMILPELESKPEKQAETEDTESEKKAPKTSVRKVKAKTTKEKTAAKAPVEIESSEPDGADQLEEKIKEILQSDLTK